MVISSNSSNSVFLEEHVQADLLLNKTKKRIPSPEVSQYVLDFGPVIAGDIKTKSVNITNTGIFNTNFTVIHEKLAQTGFLVELEKVKQLPPGEGIEFKISFDSAMSEFQLGPGDMSKSVESFVEFKVQQGMTVKVVLKAVITEPKININQECIDFGSITYGECKVVTIQLFNPSLVSDSWHVEYPEGDLKQERVFEVLPGAGQLEPGQYANVQVKFAPSFSVGRSVPDKIGKSYQMKIPLVVANSTQRCTVLVRGKGNDTILDISEGLLEFNPILPYDTGSVLKITATNQSENPIEFFSLDYDKDYLEDEKIMRELPGWDDNGTLLLPPGNKLPNDIYQWYAKKQTDTSLEIDATHNLQTSKSEVIDNPVTRALANHLGLDLSPAGRRAHNRRGISICVHGAPKSGKSSISMAISQYYGAALFSIDDIVTECLQNLESDSAKKAAELCKASFAEMKAEALAQSGESAVTGDTKGTDDTARSTIIKIIKIVPRTTAPVLELRVRPPGRDIGILVSKKWCESFSGELLPIFVLSKFLWVFAPDTIFERAVQRVIPKTPKIPKSRKVNEKKKQAPKKLWRLIVQLLWSRNLTNQ